MDTDYFDSFEGEIKTTNSTTSYGEIRENEKTQRDEKVWKEGNV
jgi:hypothetical protein